MTKLANTNDGTCDTDCSLREAIDVATDGATVTFQTGLSGTINLTSGEIVIDENTLTINALGTSLTLDGQNTNRIFNHTGNGTLTVNSLTFQNDNAGNADGGAISSVGTSVIIESTFRNNTSTINSFTPSVRGGGAIHAIISITVTNSTFTNNVAGRGGAMASPGAITVTRSIVSGNTANEVGGGMYANGGVTIVNSLIAGNQGGRLGGGIFNRANAVLTNSTISGNRADNGGGINASFGASTVTLNNSLVLGNDAPTNPQIIAAGSITLTNSAYGFGVGESTGDTFVGLDVRDVFVDPVSAAAAPTDAGNYRLIDTSPALDGGDNA
ncbi:MAG: hypothetical protein AAF267_25290, partial [Deinococcota bacterium]